MSDIFLSINIPIVYLAENSNDFRYFQEQILKIFVDICANLFLVFCAKVLEKNHKLISSH